MNLRNFRIGKYFINIIFFFIAFSLQIKVKGWEVDFSRRKAELIESKRLPATYSDFPIPSTEVSSTSEGNRSKSSTSFSSPIRSSRLPAGIESNDSRENDVGRGVYYSIDPTQEIVILLTEKGFIPKVIYLKKGSNYKFYVANLNQNNKNSSFMLSEFSEFHATYFGEIISFNLNPKVAQAFTFECPETAAQGSIMVME